MSERPHSRWSVDPESRSCRSGRGERKGPSGILKTGVTDENRAKVLSTVKKHVVALEALRETAA